MTDSPFHRLVHAEADRLPGLIVDRYDDVFVLQANTAGMDRLMPEIVAALVDVLPVRAVVARNDSPVRGHEGLPNGWNCCSAADAAASVIEGGVRFPVDLLAGQKTGWFFDQRPNRDRVGPWLPVRACWTCSATPAPSACAAPQPGPRT